MVALALQLCEHDEGDDHLVLGKALESPRVGQQDRRVEDEGAFGVIGARGYADGFGHGTPREIGQRIRASGLAACRTKRCVDGCVTGASQAQGRAVGADAGRDQAGATVEDARPASVTTTTWRAVGPCAPSCEELLDVTGAARPRDEHQGWRQRIRT
jgi:hypothetical protein